MLILIADPCPTTRRTLCRLLREHQLATVRSYAGLRQAAQERAPDVLLVDLHLPDAYALDALPELLRIAPVILMSGYMERSEAERAIRTGVLAAVAKDAITAIPGVVASALTWAIRPRLAH